MRSIDYESLWGDDVCSREHLSIADVLRSHPYLLVGGLVPPLVLVNTLLSRGEVHAGMSGGGRWQPIEITAAEYEEVVADLVRNGAHGRALRYIEPPAWVRDPEDWSLWIAEQAFSIPLAENRRFHELMATIRAAMDEAADRGDEDARVGHLVRLSAITTEWSAFINRHRRPPSE
ncbi:MAG: hypothetical protein BGP24_20595 [Lysobacterales bacterium 69-70]|nr:hypothetical protein [Xanthomonadaceae bacterium]ODU35879.1 MAG: hypothetical protein ABS97_03395 [Xanthomonadaceae bacterium SCN 69-320]ODV18381.1 MAG: hypothetical protein ABT27_14040 [Xanthomonadaceae bacterium SCN 69-25]OJY97362.1 MAG: hypothetical protein BGP24_20595 [Xanthomonadales bacterium 69-70]